MTWQPPIPAGALYRPESLALGPALALLGYCYDRVDRDGTITIRLDRAADVIGKPYGTIKDWWADLKQSGILSGFQDKGKHGWHARFGETWLCWRTMRSNYGDVQGSVMAEKSSLNEQQSNTQGSVKEEIPALNTDKDSFKEISRSFEGGDFSLEPSAYKVLHIDQDSMLQHSQSAHAAQPTRKPKTRASKATQTQLPDPVRDAVCDVCGIDPVLCTNVQRLQVAQTVKLIRRSGANQQQSDEEIVVTIRYVAEYYAQHDWRGQKGQKPTPAHLREVWRQAIEYRQKTQARASPAYHQARASPEKDVVTEERIAFIRQQIQENRNGHHPTRTTTEHGG